MFFSIIIPVYNVEDYLKQCIQSVLQQTYRKYELLLINDGSTDRSGEICKEFEKYDNRVIVINQENGGAASARNKGIKAASGDYIFFIDSDDYLADRNVLEKLNILIADTDAELIKFKQLAFENGTDKFYPVHKYKDIKIINNLSGPEAMISLCQSKQMVISAASYVIKRKIITENSIFFKENVYAEDINFTPKVYISVKKVFTLDEYLYYRRQNRPGQVTYQANLKRDIDALKILEEWFELKGEVLTTYKGKEYFWNYLADIYISIIGNQYLYSAAEAEIRMKELAKRSYILEDYILGEQKPLLIIYKLFSFKFYVYVLSSIKKLYRKIL